MAKLRTSGPDCNCLDKTKEKIVEHIVNDTSNQKDFILLESNWENSIFYPVSMLYVNFVWKYKFTKKDGSDSKPKNGHTKIFFSYCPFCGKEYTKGN